MPSQLVIYRVFFKFKGDTVSVDLPPNYGIVNLDKGFWLNYDLEFDVHFHSYYWIPMSQVQYVEKIKK